MTEQEALALVRARAGRRRLFLAVGLGVLLLWGAVRVAIRPWSWERLLDSALPAVFWLALMWFMVAVPARDSFRRLTRVDRLVRGEVVRLRADLVTADVPGERPREWGVGRRGVKRLALGDEIWISPAVADDDPVVAVCVPRAGAPFIVTDAPGIYTSLR